MLTIFTLSRYKVQSGLMRFSQAELMSLEDEIKSKCQKIWHILLLVRMTESTSQNYKLNPWQRIVLIFIHQLAHTIMALPLNDYMEMNDTEFSLTWEALFWTPLCWLILIKSCFFFISEVRDHVNSLQDYWLFILSKEFCDLNDTNASNFLNLINIKGIQSIFTFRTNRISTF